MYVLSWRQNSCVRLGSIERRGREREKERGQEEKLRRGRDRLEGEKSGKESGSEDD